MTKLNADIVRAMRLAYDTGCYSYGDLAAIHGVSVPHVSQIIKGHAWTKVEPAKSTYRRGTGRRPLSMDNGALTPDQLRSAHSMWRSGMALRDVAQIMSVPKSTLHRRLTLLFGGD